MKRIAVLTTGGDAPGMNAAIRAAVRQAVHEGVEVIGVEHGYRGLVMGKVTPLDHRSVSGIVNQGGTVLKTARCFEFTTGEGMKAAYRTIEEHGIDGLVVIGGNGSFTGAHAFHEKYGVPVIGVPASIDNDINGIELTIGSDTAVNTALAAIDNIRDTATSMERIFVVEVMGRKSGYIALQVALAGGCEGVIIPEREVDMDRICDDIEQGNSLGKMSWIIVVAEGAASAPDVAKKITDSTGFETRAVVLGHIQRGGRPTALSRTLALTLGQAAVERLLAGETDRAVYVKDGGEVSTIELEEAIRKKDLDADRVLELIKVLT